MVSETAAYACATAMLVSAMPYCEAQDARAVHLFESRARLTLCENTQSRWNFLNQCAQDIAHLTLRIHNKHVVSTISSMRLPIRHQELALLELKVRVALLTRSISHSTAAL